MTVEQQEVCDTLVTPRKPNAILTRDGHASHDQATRQSSFELGYSPRWQEIRCRAKVDNESLQLERPGLDQRDIVTQKQHGKLGRWRYRGCNPLGHRQRLLARKTAVAYQDADMADADRRNAARLYRRRNLINLCKHAVRRVWEFERRGVVSGTMTAGSLPVQRVNVSIPLPALGRGGGAGFADITIDPQGLSLRLALAEADLAR